MADRLPTHDPIPGQHCGICTAYLRDQERCALSTSRIGIKPELPWGSKCRLFHSIHPSPESPLDGPGVIAPVARWRS